MLFPQRATSEVGKSTNSNVWSYFWNPHKLCALAAPYADDWSTLELWLTRS